MPKLLALALLPFMLASPAGAEAPAQVAVQVWSFGFGPQPIRLAAGKPVTLTFVNRSGAGHDFSAPAFFQHATIVAGSAPGGEIELRPHETKSVTLIPQAGTYRAHCGHFLHKQLGMSDVIVVN